MSRQSDLVELTRKKAQALSSGSKNLIINGDCNVSQRGDTKTGITGETYTNVDRFRLAIGALGTWTTTRESNGPDGFNTSLKVNCTTADASPTSTDYAVLQYRIEAIDLQHLGYGTANGKTLTLSFWVKSNKTGDATIDLIEHDAGFRSMYPQYTINTADTWEYKTVQIVPDASGAFDRNSNIGLEIGWWINSGSAYSTGSNTTTWNAQDSASRNASNLGVGGAVNDYFQITGVQLEVGSNATDFEHMSYADQLRKCQRYFEVQGHYMDEAGNGIDSYTRLQFNFKETKRAAPTITLGAGSLTDGAGTDVGGAWMWRNNALVVVHGSTTYDAEL